MYTSATNVSKLSNISIYLYHIMILFAKANFFVFYNIVIPIVGLN